MKVAEGAPVVCGVSAIARAEDQVSALAAEAEEFPRPEIVAEMAAPVDPPLPVIGLDGDRLLPRRRRVDPESYAPRDLAGAVGADAANARAVDDSPGQSQFVARPDLNVLAQVLQGLRRMA